MKTIAPFSIAGKLAFWALLSGFTMTMYGQEKPTYLVDETIMFGNKEIVDPQFGSRPIAAVADANGVVSRFIANELIYADSEDKLPVFISRYKARELKVVGETTTANGLHPPAAVKMHVLRVDPTQASVDHLGADFATLTLNGSHKFSSSSAMQLAALMAREAAAGTKVGLNFVSEAHDYATSSTEQADANGVSDAYQWPEFKSQAWEFVSQYQAEKGLQRRIKIAIIDVGFWLNSNGVPCDITPDSLCGPGTVAHGASDLPNLPQQFNTITGGPFAGGANTGSCSGNPACIWHGNRSASVALAAIDNKAGAAGMGGLVADPMLFKSDLTDGSVGDALFNATGFADIVNMSFGGTCNDLCEAGRDIDGVNGFLGSALDSGMLLVASAGNSGANAGNTWPCEYTSGKGNKVYCVGALGNNLDSAGYFVSESGQAISYSNFGVAVNIWAPTNIHAMPDGGSNGALTVHNGTSASAPYVSGVAAMVKAINPNLDAMGIKNILGDALFVRGSAISNTILFPDPKVSLVINPYPAVVMAAGGYHLHPVLQVTSPADGATVQADPSNPVTFKATAKDVNDGAWPQAATDGVGLASPITWTSDVDGALTSASNTSAGTSLTYDFTFAPDGLRHITATAVNSAKEKTQVTFALTITHSHVTPTPVITWPPANTTVPPGTYTVTGFAKSTDPGALGNFDCSRLKFDGNITAVAMPNSNGQCQAQMTFAAGTQQITLSATDQFGDTGKTSVSLTVTAPQPSGLSVQILQPTAGSSDIVTVGGSGNIGLSGSASPIPHGTTAGYTWSWYLTSAGPSTAQNIGTGQNVTWKTPAGICKSSGTKNVTLLLNASDSEKVGNATKTVSTGSASTKIQLSCQENN